MGTMTPLMLVTMMLLNSEPTLGVFMNPCVLHHAESWLWQGSGDMGERTKRELNVIKANPVKIRK